LGQPIIRWPTWKYSSPVIDQVQRPRFGSMPLSIMAAVFGDTL
jgi:hypothetical protein